MWPALRASLNKEKYEEYMRVKEGKELITVMAQGSGKEVTNGLIMVEEKDGLTVVSFDGTILVKDLNYLSKHHSDWH
jgi:phosphatidate phosphatase PAH1